MSINTRNIRLWALLLLALIVSGSLAECGPQASITSSTTAKLDTKPTCYEQKPQGARVQWNPMGQEVSFAGTHALLVVTTFLNSTQWQKQSQDAAGVTKIEVGPAVNCGKM